MRYEKLTLAHCTILTAAAALGAAAYQYSTGFPDYTQVITPTVVVAVTSVANYMLARFLPFSGKANKNGRHPGSPQPSKPQH